MSEYVEAVTDQEFDIKVLQADLPVLVDFWAEWCGPCKMIAPILDEYASENSSKVKVVKMDVDENKQTAPKYGVRGIPTLILFKNGEVQATKVGALSKSQLEDFVNNNA